MLLVFVFQMPISIEAAEASEDGKAFYIANHHIHEVHINLSGKNIWLDPEITVNDSKWSPDNELRANQPEKFVSVDRYGKDYYGHDRTLASTYSGARLAESFQRIPVYYAPPETNAPIMMPVVKPSSYPDVSGFLDKFVTFTTGTPYAYDAAAVTIYQYYYYADRVEVIPALNLAGSEKLALLKNKIPFVEVHISNLHVRSIARLEINGQAVSHGDSAWKPESLVGGCASRNYDVELFESVDKPLKVRWQFAQPNPKWHEAIVVVPIFKSEKVSMGSVSSDSILFYFQKNGSVVAEREQVIELGNGQMAVRSVGPEAPLLSTPPCGRASDRWTDNVTKLRN